jgi:uncharacterized glyoxalase superfamily protein PhnB
MSEIQRITAIRELVPLLSVQDIDHSAAFYRDQLGFEMTTTWVPNGQLLWCRLQRSGSAIMLQQADAEDGPAENRGHGVHFYFNCDDVDDLCAEFAQRGLHLNPPTLAFYGLKQVFLQDPDGYELCFQSPALVDG